MISSVMADTVAESRTVVSPTIVMVCALTEPFPDMSAELLVLNVS